MAGEDDAAIQALINSAGVRQRLSPTHSIDVSVPCINSLEQAKQVEAFLIKKLAELGVTVDKDNNRIFADGTMVLRVPKMSEEVVKDAISKVFKVPLDEVEVTFGSEGPFVKPRVPGCPVISSIPNYKEPASRTV